MDKEQVEYDGLLWYRYPNAKSKTQRNYFQRGRKRLHVYVYEKAHGPIPKGYVVHHKDNNPGNNDLNNLECKELGTHQREHVLSNPKYRFDKALIHLATIRPLSIAWHKSPEGKEWHKKQGKESWANRQLNNSVCQVCNIKYSSLKASGLKFCSNNCKSKYRRDHKLDFIAGICEWCKSDFTFNKYLPKKYCSKSCSGKAVAFAKKQKYSVS